MRGIRGFLVFTSGLLALSATSAAGGETAPSPVVVELFTSQGCSSCPPADALARELTHHEDILVLSLPVDYWDYLGWEDTFAQSTFTRRQRKYARNLLGHGRVYTPQIIVNGERQMVGSRRRTVMSAIADEMEEERTVSLSVLPGGPNSDLVVLVKEDKDLPAGRCDLWLVQFDNPDAVAIRRGENAGETIQYAHVVENMRNLGVWRGETAQFTVRRDVLQADKDAGYALVLQEEKTGPVLGALVLQKPVRPLNR